MTKLNERHPAYKGAILQRGFFQLQQEAWVFGFGSDMIHPIDDEKLESGKLCEQEIGGIIGKGGIEEGEQLLEFEEPDFEAGFTGPDAEGCRQMRFPRYVKLYIKGIMQSTRLCKVAEANR